MANPFFTSYISDVLGRVNDQATLENTSHYDQTTLPFLPVNRHAPILEIGFGMGHMAFYLLMKDFSNYLGIDISAECVDYVRRNVTKNVLCVEDTLEFLSRRKGFNTVIMYDVIEHIPKAQQLDYIRAIRNVLDEGGAFLLRTENTVQFSGYFQHVADYTHEYTFSERSLGQLLAVGGFKEIAIYGDPLPVTGIRSSLLYAVTKIWHGIMRIIYSIERPGCVMPKIFTKNLYVVCKK